MRSKPLYLGRVFKHKESINFVAGTSITLSYRALEMMVEQFEKEEIEECSPKSYIKRKSAEDLATGTCLNKIGIFPSFTRDQQNREMFMVLFILFCIY